ncbi:ATP-sensitive inward rectifier potassium channel 10 [Polynucleobacter sp. MG-5-Ahmo-C2]|uniref:ion channel n=1 Tax=unclassified Polynucleobacter TaxID=2640945 RepID=UPI001BFE2FDB|nr:MULTISPECIES: ion channel [unclassified Polynucleobacter]QWD71907.1 ATP-sensitive inward rectifier potassium channel 10 [Polynucleobacter sp. UB-Raua-W9]QWD97989.1 ATP-sensitive inward rectifier potassium channel 10 [Polynucleobacter sp. MG-5-Ahmo-C2]
MRKFLFNRRPARIDLDEYRATLTRSEVARPENNFYHWLLGTSWASFMLLVVLVYLGTNLVFAFAYLACGDGAITHAQSGSLLDVFFFSVQTMATIGYGRMTPVGSWPNAIVTFEAFFGIVYSALTTGLAFARFTRPTAGVRFSKVAVVGNHDGIKTLKFRVANDRSSHIVEAQLRLWLIAESMTSEGERYRRSVELALHRSESPVFSLTWTAMHSVDETSALNDYLGNSALNGRWHLLITFTGYHESLANQVYARHVYLPRDVQQNATFVDIVTVSSDGGRIIDLSNFEQWVPNASDRIAGEFL